MSAPSVIPAAVLNRDSYWWGRLVDELLVTGLIRDVEAAKGQQSAHERECALRYGQINRDHQDMKASLAEVVKKLDKIATEEQKAAWSANWKMWTIASALVSLLLGAVAWEAGQLYLLEPLRVHAAQVAKP